MPSGFRVWEGLVVRLLHSLLGHCCGNCQHWRLQGHEAAIALAAGHLVPEDITIKKCLRWLPMHFITTDLTVCSAWERRR